MCVCLSLSIRMLHVLRESDCAQTTGGGGGSIRRGGRLGKEELSKSHATEKNSLPKPKKKGGIYIYIYIYIYILYIYICIYIYINYRKKRAWVEKMREANICKAVVKAVVKRRAVE